MKLKVSQDICDGCPKVGGNKESFPCQLPGIAWLRRLDYFVPRKDCPFMLEHYMLREKMEGESVDT